MNVVLMDIMAAVASAPNNVMLSTTWSLERRFEADPFVIAANTSMAARGSRKWIWTCSYSIELDIWYLRWWRRWVLHWKGIEVDHKRVLTGHDELNSWRRINVKYNSVNRMNDVFSMGGTQRDSLHVKARALFYSGHWVLWTKAGRSSMNNAIGTREVNFRIVFKAKGLDHWRSALTKVAHTLKHLTTFSCW